MEVLRVKRDMISTRDIQESYRSVHYEDPYFGDQWYYKVCKLIV